MEHDPNALKSLYMLCFPEETPESTDFIFSSLLKNSLPVVTYSGETPVSMLFLIEADLRLQAKMYPVYYLYAACTHPDYRGQGLMHILLKDANNAAATYGKQGIFLRPASPSLVAFYETAGYVPYFAVKTFSYVLPEESGINKDYKQFFSPEDFRSVRNKLLDSLCKGYVDWKEESIKPAIDAAFALGGGAFTDNIDSPTSLILFEQDGNTLFVRELFTKTDLEQSYILNFALHKTGLKNAIVRTISDDQNCELFGMLATENKELLSTESPGCYQGLAFD